MSKYKISQGTQVSTYKCMIFRYLLYNLITFEIRAYFRVKTAKIYHLYVKYVKKKDQRI